MPHSRWLASGLVLLACFAISTPFAAAAPAKGAASAAAVQRLEAKVKGLTRLVLIQSRQIRLLNREFSENNPPSEISSDSGGAGVFTSPTGTVELRGSGGALVLSSQGLSTHGPTISSAMPIHFNQFACPNYPILLYNTSTSRNLISGSMFGC
jgi:hypothetical protein